ncbi:MAG TPA: hypothetical protein PLZ93_03280 [Nocardioides sp.]|uniref:hypothetical protein n=1 Tax=uncultured Nocardioides sp. TaxID=198441 RepID=UPI000EC590C6|nr:hypothetical protein [uncultured Nocardioides sp.]HCB03054.1 hypothetical protein [Nocardioides sp.]HRD60011.1 hypothetical protein [Nocardioides sp.]HRI94613.1 hypothetical protein [Nocardioides sp.]HRK44618.1 hypothetical protein [Nocardioides sp.]
MLDIEHRTANRRLLRDVALANPEFFRGRAAARTSAAAISYMIAHANDSVGLYRPLTVSELLASYGVDNASQRSRQFRGFLGLDEYAAPGGGPMALGAPDYLVSDRRIELIREREMWQD